MNARSKFPTVSALVFATGALGLFTASAGAVAALPMYPPVGEVPAMTKSNISVFRDLQTQAPPQGVLRYGFGDPATGMSVFGRNPALAKPAYPWSAGERRRHFWLIPGAKDQLTAVEYDGDGHRVDYFDLAFTVDKSFLKHGAVSHSAAPLGSSAPTKIRAVLPDSIRQFHIVWKRGGEKPRVKRYEIRDNSIIRSVRNAKYFVIAGKKYELQVKVPPPIRDGEATSKPN